MSWLYFNLITLLWLAFLILWRILALRSKTNQRLEPASSRILRAVLFLSAIGLFLWNRIPVPWLHLRFLFWPLADYNTGLVLTAAGIFFAVWARLHLRGNWSSAVTVKQNHELIVTGPYRFIRHPIYTGILLGLVGSAVALGELRGLIAVAMIFLVLWRKLRLEEQWMREQFGPTYADYSRHTAALIPGIL